MDTIIDLTKKLVNIPSYLDTNVNESEVGEFLYKFLQTLPWLDVQKQYVDDNRFNIFAKDKYPTRVLICNHIDTVQPQQGWTTSPCECVIKGKRLYGLGSSDTKGNIAALLSAIRSAGPTKGLVILLYIDEEYDFKGIKTFIKEFKKKIDPKIIASADGGNLELGNSCRGLIEINFKIKGKAGHSAIPASGKNAIIGTFKAFQSLKKFVSLYETGLGKSIISLAWIQGGQSKPGTKTLGKEGNVIPDFAEVVIEIRTSDPKLDAQILIKKFNDYIKNEGLTVVSFVVRHDLGAWITNKSELGKVCKLLNRPKFTKAEDGGYVDLQMLWQNFGKPICFTFGGSEGNTAHKPNEYVKIDKLQKAVVFWQKFIETECK